MQFKVKILGQEKTFTVFMKKVKGNIMQKDIRQNSVIKANRPILRLMNLIWGL